MNLKHINDRKLIELTEKNRSLELNALTSSLHYLREIESRRLYSKLGYTSLYDFATKHLKHSEDEACRRISAMRIVREIPEIEHKLKAGAFTLTTLAQAQTFFRRETKHSRKLSKTDKIEFLNKIEGKSKRETERVVASMSPDIQIPDKIRALSRSQILLQYAADASLEGKLNEIKGLLAHSHPNISLGELTAWLCDSALQNLKSPAPARVPEQSNRPMSKAAVRRAVWLRDNNQCQQCKSGYALQIDHIKPKALGGDDSIENLRLLCRNCNQRAAIEVFGRKKMGNFISSPEILYRV